MRLLVTTVVANFTSFGGSMLESRCFSKEVEIGDGVSVTDAVVSESQKMVDEWNVSLSKRLLSVSHSILP